MVKNYHHEIITNGDGSQNIINYYTIGKTGDRISDLRISEVQHRYLPETGYADEYEFYATVSGNCNGYGGLGFKHLNVYRCQNRDEARQKGLKKLSNWLKKNEGIVLEIEKL